MRPQYMHVYNEEIRKHPKIIMETLLMCESIYVTDVGITGWLDYEHLLVME